ncbi:hypothetical protein ACJX0J_009825, partial [Zea mays]
LVCMCLTNHIKAISQIYKQGILIERGFLNIDHTHVKRNQKQSVYKHFQTHYNMQALGWYRLNILKIMVQNEI